MAVITVTQPIDWCHRLLSGPSVAHKMSSLTECGAPELTGDSRWPMRTFSIVPWCRICVEKGAPTHST